MDEQFRKQLGPTPVTWLHRIEGVECAQRIFYILLLNGLKWASTVTSTLDLSLALG